MVISQSQLDGLRSQVRTDESLGSVLQTSLALGQVAQDCQTFDFDIKILSVSGSICKSGRFEMTATVFGIEVGHTVVDLNKGEFCQHPHVGELVGIKYCFALRDGCLYTSGQIDGWFEKRTDWNEKILCL